MAASQAPTPVRMPTPPSRWTLRTKLLASVLALFTVVMLATSALTVLETQRYLTAQLVKDLDGAVDRVRTTGAAGRLRPRRRPGRLTRGAGRSPPRVAATCSCSASCPDGSVAVDAQPAPR